MRHIFVLIPFLAAAIIPTPHLAHGCAPAPPPGAYVYVNAEEAVIVFDAATGTEHFIRRADFRTNAKDFGFLVPTPAKPDLGETEARIFDSLSTATAPRHVFSGKVQRIVQKRSRNVSGAPPRTAAAPPPPQILDEKKGVAGYDAVVLRAADIEGLKKWLQDHEYDSRPALMEWLSWYVENQWIITAFKVSKQPGASGNRWNKAVRLSFQTKAPFYPYREPADLRTTSPAASRTLRVYCLADARVDGSLGESGTWPGRTVWANACPDDTLKRVVGGLGLPPKDSEALGTKKWHLTEFEDTSSPRPGTHEVYFHKSADQKMIERPVIYYDKYEYVYADEGGAAAVLKSPRAGISALPAPKRARAAAAPQSLASLAARC